MKIKLFKKAAHWFNIELTIRIFGHVIYHVEWPASNDVPPENLIEDD